MVAVPPVAFVGMIPWQPASEIIECVGTAMGKVDLHNEANFLGVAILTGEKGLSLELSFERVATSRDTARRLRLVFSGIEDLRVRQRVLSHQEDWALFNAVDYYLDRSGEPSFEVDTSVLVLQFKAIAVSMVSAEL